MQSHVYELTERGDHVTIHRVGEPGPTEHYNNWHLADENASDMQEVYGVVDAGVKRFIPFMVLAKQEIQHQEHQILNLCRWTSRSERSPLMPEALSTWSTRTHWMHWRIYLSESLVRWAKLHKWRTLEGWSTIVSWTQSPYARDAWRAPRRGLLHPPGRISCCQKAVRKALISRLRRLGMEAMDKDPRYL